MIKSCCRFKWPTARSTV